MASEATATHEAPQPVLKLGAPVFVSLLIALAIIVRAGLGLHFHVRARELLANVVAMLVIALSVYLHRTRSIRFIALIRDGKRSDGTYPEPHWDYANASFSSDGTTFLVAGFLVTWISSCVFEYVATKDLPPLGEKPFMAWCVAIAIVMFVVHLRSRGIAKRMIVAPPVTETGMWGSITGTMRVAKPKLVFGVEAVATFSIASKVVSSASTGSSIAGTSLEVVDADVSSIPFEVVADKTWRVSPAQATWASSGRVSPPVPTDSGNGMVIDFVEVLPVKRQLLVVGRATEAGFTSPDLDSLYLYPFHAGSDPRAELRSYRMWSYVIVALPLIAFAISFVR